MSISRPPVRGRPPLVLAAQKLGNASAAGGREVGGQRIHDLFCFRDGETRHRKVDDQIGTHGVPDILGRDQRIGRDFREVETHGTASSFAVLVRDGQLYVAVILLKCTGIVTGADARQRICYRVDRDCLRIGKSH